METIKDTNVVSVLLPMAIVIFIIAGGVVLLSLYFQKSLYAQKLREEELKNRHRAELLRHSISVQEMEQKRIAQDLHDELGAALSMMRMHLMLIEQKGEALPEGVMKSVHNARQLSEAAMASTRSISHRLMPPQLEAFGLLKTLEGVARQLNSAGNIAVNLVNDSNAEELAFPVSLGLYRIAMELINNTIRHAQANKVDILLTVEEKQVTFRYTDNGIGISGNNANGLGHKSIEARVSALDGVFEMGNSMQQPGFYALVKIPLEAIS
jgi:signal transduction histidine kinase